MVENLIVGAIVGIAAVLMLRRGYKSLAGRGKRCACSEMRCAVFGTCESEAERKTKGMETVTWTRTTDECTSEGGALDQLDTGKGSH